MAYVKSFPVLVKKPVYTKWEEICLSDDEDAKIDNEARKKNLRIMKECVNDAKQLIKDSGMKLFPSAVSEIASSLFSRSSQSAAVVKKDLCRRKFDEAIIMRFGEQKKLSVK